MKGIFIISLPKSGTNMLASLLEGNGYKHTITIAHKKIKNKEFVPILYNPFTSDRITVGIDMPKSINADKVFKSLRRISDGNFGIGHIPFDARISTQLESLNIEPLVMLRDPRSVALSSIRYILTKPEHWAHKKLTSQNFEEQVRSVINGIKLENVHYLSLKERCLRIEEWREKVKFSIKFEDLVGSKGGGLDDKRDSIITDLAKNLDWSDSVNKNFFGKRNTFRSGQIDGWRDQLSVSEQDFLSAELEEILMMWDYE